MTKHIAADLPRTCTKCGVVFRLCERNPVGQQCLPCRYRIKRGAKGALADWRAGRIGPAPRIEQPLPGEAHSTDWDRRSLGIIEAAYLRMAWGPDGADFVTRISNGSDMP